MIATQSPGMIWLTDHFQSYGIHYRDENDVEVITYVDYVDPLGQAHRAGLRSGNIYIGQNNDAQTENLSWYTNNVSLISWNDDAPFQTHGSSGIKGDVILSINGQDVERADHSTLVSIIQTCPNRIRMVVLFENCVRKVELHMKYIRLQQILEQKAREYQEVCAREKSLLSSKICFQYLFLLIIGFSSDLIFKLK